MGTRRGRNIQGFAAIVVIILFLLSFNDSSSRQALYDKASSVVAGISDSSKVDSSKQIDGSMISSERSTPRGEASWAAHITEFLATAPRSKTSEKICSDQGKAATLGYLHASSKCPAWTWLKMYWTPLKESRAAVFVDIGCNKGYSTASFYEHFAPESGVNHQSLCDMHKKIGTKKYTGVCRDCFDKPTYGRGGVAPRIFCIDGSPRTHNHTKIIAEQLKKKSDSVRGWELFHLAVSNSSGFLDYEDCDNEDCGIARSGGRGKKDNRTIRVPKTSYDDFIKLHGIGFVDVVKLDTEGEEPLIIQGMHESLKANQIGFLAFEVSGNGKAWYSAYSMTRIVDLLDAYGYDCYVDAGDQEEKHDLLPLLTGCKGKRFEQTYSPKNYMSNAYMKIRGLIPQWGNIICGSRKSSEIRHIFSRLNTCGQHCQS